MRDFLSEFMPHAAVGILAVVCIPIMIAVLPFWCIGKLVGAYLERLAA